MTCKNPAWKRPKREYLPSGMSFNQTLNEEQY